MSEHMAAEFMAAWNKWARDAMAMPYDEFVATYWRGGEMTDLPGVEPFDEFVKRMDQALGDAVKNPPVGEFGFVLLRIPDVRRLITEAQRGKERK